MKIAEFQQPRFILIEKGHVDYHDEHEFHFSESNSFKFGVYENRTWVYHLASESLIEFVYMNELGPLYFPSRNKTFYYMEDIYTGYFVKDNTKRLGFDQDLVLESAWEFFRGKGRWDMEFKERSKKKH